MDTQAAQAAATSMGEPAVTAALVALAIGLSEIIKQLISWAGKRVSGQDHSDAKEISALRDSMVAIAASLARASEAQDRLAEKLDRLEMRFDEHDRNDAINFARLGDGVARIEVIASSNRTALTEAAEVHRSHNGKLDAITSTVNRIAAAK